MKLPKQNIGGFAREVVDSCSSSREDRLQRGAMYRNLYLTGDENANPATYPKTFAYIDNLSSFLYSPVDFRYLIEDYGLVTPSGRAMMRVAGSELYKRLRRAGVDTCAESAVNWGLVKGKAFIKLLWTSQGFQPTLIQPEMMGVFREDLGSLDEQDAFFQTTYLTYDRFAQLVQFHPNQNELMRKVQRYISTGKGQDSPEAANNLKQIILGGLQPFQQAGGQSNQKKSKGIVNWLDGPYPNLAPDVLNKLIRLDELWVRDDDRGEWTTIQFVGEDCVITGEDRHRNIFADGWDPMNKEKSLKPSDLNPLAGSHPFIEICPNPLDGYFWGRSELCNVALLQLAVNSRMDGIGHLLRMQEKPPRFFKGTQGVTQRSYSALNKPGGYMSDSNPNADVKDLAPDLPDGLFETLHEYLEMFNDMSGFTPVMQGRGEAGVRAGGHAQTLTQNASPRFKDRALLVERQLETLGGLALDILKAHVPDIMEAWVPEKDAGILSAFEDPNWLDEPPVKGMKKVQFTFHDLPDDCKVSVDSHSSSPAFSQETKALLFELFKAGAISLEQLIYHLHPPGQDSMIQDLQRAEIEKAQFFASHPEAAAEEMSKGKSKKKK